MHDNCFFVDTRLFAFETIVAVETRLDNPDSAIKSYLLKRLAEQHMRFGSDKRRSTRRSLKKVDDTPKEDELFEVEYILESKIKYGKLHYFVKWLGYPEDQNSWEPADALAHCVEVIEEFSNRKKNEEDKDMDCEKGEKSSRSTASSEKYHPKQMAKRVRGRPKSSDSSAQSSRAASEKPTTSKQASELASNNDAALDNGEIIMAMDSLDWSSAVQITAATNEFGLYFCVEFGNNGDFAWVPNEICREMIPQLLLDFYEKRICFA
uniref:Chromo domain-containing protein n=1 Tax=Acrobeloides nanus TaxID=290746 RepID=A0A914CHC5_9BILA